MDNQAPRSHRLVLLAALILLVPLVAACGGNGSSGATWTFGPVAAATAVPGSSASSSAGADASSSDSPKPFSGRMAHEVQLIDGYLTMYMSLENTGTEPLTFLNTLYDDEPDQLYSPTVVFPFVTGESAAVTRAGQFFPSPAIVQPGDRAVYIMGGQPANGSGELAAPVANIKFCPTRGMDDIPGVPLEVEDISWSSSGGATTVSGTLVESIGSQRQSLPTVGVAFFDAADAFIGAVVHTRTGDRLAPNSKRPFEITGRGIAADRIARAEAYAFLP